MVRPWWLKAAAAVRSSSVVVGRVPGQDSTQMPLTENRYPVGDLGPGGQHEPFRIGVRPGTSGWNRDRGDAGVSEDRVERCGELPGSVEGRPG